MILSLTATRAGLSLAQRATLPGLFATLPAILVHGGAVGGDEEVDAFLAPLFARDREARRRSPDAIFPAFIPIEVYPEHRRGREHWIYVAPFRELRAVSWPDEPLARNRTIVRRGDRLLAFPATEEEELRSGTWMTVRFARKLGRPVTIVTPSGKVVE